MPSSPYKQTVTEFMMRWLYSSIIAVLIPFALLNLLIKAGIRGPEYRKRKLERFGFLPKIDKQGGILIHCVSVGEVVAATPLIKRIQKQQPELPITFTTTTPTGSSQVRKTFGESVTHFYLPYDLHMAMYGLLRRVKPEKLLITEVELWPNLIHACWQKSIPVYLINARLTDKSAARYAKFKVLFTPMMQKIHTVCAQGERDLANYQKLGVEEDKLLLTNNMKFDLQLTEQDKQKTVELNKVLQPGTRPVLLGASTHDPEEKILLRCYQALKPAFPDLLLILTPRHPQRFERVENTIIQSKLIYQKLSDKKLIASSTDVLLVDEMGVLRSIYALATIAFVGGSLADRGGHNALEAALLSKPVLMGPSQHNNPAICDALAQSEAMETVAEENELTDKIRFWLANPKDANAAGEAGAKVLSENAGAIDRTLKVIGF